jgi:hypothetical protein
MSQLEKDVCAVIHRMEAACGRDGLRDMSKDELCNLLSDVYCSLCEIVY